MNANEMAAIFLTIKLASLTTLLLLLIGTPIAWWLSQTKSAIKIIASAIIAMPLVLPPTVLGFYLLLLLRPDGIVGKLADNLNLGHLPFTFPGLVIGSVIYSIPYVVQPIQNAFESLGSRPLEIAATLRAKPWDRFFFIALPMASSGLFTAAILGFAHTVGEFGVVLMLGGNIPGETSVLSIAIYNHVEALEYKEAHLLAGGLLLFSFLVLTLMYSLRRPPRIAA